MIKAIKKVVLILLSCTFMISLNSCAIHNIIRIMKYNREVEKNIPDSFRVELPLKINPAGYFCIQAHINNQYGVDFMIDTGAAGGGVIRSDTLKKLGASYWNTFPIPIKDASGHKTQIDLYHFNQFDISSISFGQPLFIEIRQKESYLYKALHKNLLGTWMLRNLNWKFSIDEGKMILFSKTDENMRLRETVGYTKIKGGTGIGRNNKLTFPLIKQTEKFMFDSGYDGEIQINNKLFTKLSKQMPYRTIMGRKGSFIYLFEKVDILWNDITVPRCEIVYNPASKLTLIGNKLMRRFNFVLAYRASNSHSSISSNDLYIQPIKEFDTVKSDPAISNFGFYARKEEEKLIVNAIEIGGLAEKAGLKLQDEIVRIDNGTFDLNTEFVEDNLLKYLLNKESVVIEVKREDHLLFISLF